MRGELVHKSIESRSVVMGMKGKVGVMGSEFMGKSVVLARSSGNENGMELVNHWDRRAMSWEDRVGKATLERD